MLLHLQIWKITEQLRRMKSLALTGAHLNAARRFPSTPVSSTPVSVNLVALPGSRGGSRPGSGQVPDPAHRRAPYERLGFQTLLEGTLFIFWHLPDDQNTFHVLSALGLEPTTLGFSARLQQVGTSSVKVASASEWEGLLDLLHILR